jgi:hypothetical protein
LYCFPIEQVFENLPQGLAVAGAKAMTSINQALQTNPFNGSSSIKLNRRGRLARTVLVLSLATVLGSVVSANAGAGTHGQRAAAGSFVTVTVAPGETLWSLANRMSGGADVRSLVSEIQEINSLSSVDLAAGQKVRIPLN